jgi:CRISPR-associated protein Cmr1
VPERIESRKYISPKDDNYGFKRFGPEAYVLFPATSNKHDLVKEGLAFKAAISFERQFEADILCAVWAWVNFGGIGARTRRGCGALYCKELSPEKASFESIAQWWKRKIDGYAVKLGVERDWPTLSQILTGPAQGDSLRAWQECIKPMKDFRQGVGIGRNKGNRAPGRPGRSFWPEPDTLRRILRKHHPDHKPNPNMPDGFPRAAFGLPIIFNFMASRGDPDSEIHPEGNTRMASPLLLRPIKAQADQKVVPAVICLRGTTLKGKGLKVKGSSEAFGIKDIVDPAFAKYHNAPMQKRSSSGSATEAFLSYTKEQGFQEVPL